MKLEEFCNYITKWASKTSDGCIRIFLKKSIIHWKNLQCLREANNVVQTALDFYGKIGKTVQISEFVIRKISFKSQSSFCDNTRKSIKFPKTLFIHSNFLVYASP